jgi:ABC-type transporter Mla maintaining outer membrane lipid asymmetry permease subunit MlaE
VLSEWARAGIRVVYGIFAAALIAAIASPLVSAWNAPGSQPASWMQTATEPRNIALAVILSVILGLIAAATRQGGGGY